MTGREEAAKRYGLLQNTRMALADLKLAGYRQYVYLLFDIAGQILLPFFLVLIPAEVVRMLTQRAELSALLGSIVLWIGGIGVLDLVQVTAHSRLEDSVFRIRDVIFSGKQQRKILGCDLTALEDAEQRELYKEVMIANMGEDGDGLYAGIRGFYRYGILLVANSGGLLLFAAMAGRLQIWFVAGLLLLSAVNCFARSKALHYRFAHMGAFWKNSSRFWYLKRQSIALEKAKDIRMYGLREWFGRAFEENAQEAGSIYSGIWKHNFYAELTVICTALIRDFFAYGFLIMKMTQGQMAVADFVAYLGIVTGFGTWMEQVVENYSNLKKCSREVSLCRAFTEASEKTEDRANGRAPRRIHSIVFEDVTFGYEKEHPVLEHFDLTIREGEQIALVGTNGAGKSTLVKLLCGLYPLQGGRILVNGQDIAGMDHQQYADCISILFQDVHALPFSIAKNVACGWEEKDRQEMEHHHGTAMVAQIFQKVDKDGMRMNKYEEDRVISSLKRAKLWEKVEALPKGIHTVLTQTLDASGISLSGGETQRLLLARALYKDAPVLILDEPTSALDPIAESELYGEYAKLCEGKISIFISHRLSSTRFCDRILFLEKGAIAEQGSHEELMEKRGKYAEMFEIQAHYYQEEVKKREAEIRFF